MARAVFVAGKKVNLVPLCKEDAELCCKWLNDPDACMLFGADPFPIALDKQREYLAALPGRKDTLMLGIQPKKAAGLIGFGGLSTIEWANQRAELTIYIGEKNQRGRSYGTEAAKLILSHAFNRLNLHNVMLRVIGYNERAVRCYNNCGFRMIGRRRQAKVINGVRHDVFFMDMLAEEYFAMCGRPPRPGPERTANRRRAVTY